MPVLFYVTTSQKNERKRLWSWMAYLHCFWIPNNVNCSSVLNMLICVQDQNDTLSDVNTVDAILRISTLAPCVLSRRIARPTSVSTFILLNHKLVLTLLPRV